MGNPTGQQFEITRGNARAVVTEIGAGLRAFEVGGVPYVEAFAEDEKPPKAAGQILLPWPNRTKGGQWDFNGAKQHVEGTKYDFRGGKPLADVNLDTAFGGLEFAEDGRYHHVFSHGEQHLLVWAGPDFRWAQVFTPDDLVGRGRAVALEPMTCPADEIHSGTVTLPL